MSEFMLDWSIPIAIGIGGFTLGYYFPMAGGLLGIGGLFVWLVASLASARRRSK